MIVNELNKPYKEYNATEFQHEADKYLKAIRTSTDQHARHLLVDLFHSLMIHELEIDKLEKKIVFLKSPKYGISEENLLTPLDQFTD